MKKLKITDRGYAGHFCASRSCLFHRNTLIEYGNKRIVVSTVGNYQPKITFNDKDKYEHQIGINRFYETMAFEAMKQGVYWEANVGKEVEFKSSWSLNELKQETDLKADKMHDAVVKELSKKIQLKKNDRTTQIPR